VNTPQVSLLTDEETPTSQRFIQNKHFIHDVSFLFTLKFSCILNSAWIPKLTTLCDFAPALKEMEITQFFSVKEK